MCQGLLLIKKLTVMHFFGDLNIQGHPHRIIGSRGTTVLVNGWIFPFGGSSAMEGMQSMGLPCIVFTGIVCNNLHNFHKHLFHLY